MLETENTVKEVPVETVTVTQALASRHWQVATGVASAALIAVYWQTFGFWWHKWMADESYYSHAVLIPFMSAFVVYINRKSIAKVALRPSLWGLLLVLLMVMVHLLARMGNTASVMGLTLPVVLFGVFILLFGMEMSKHLFFPTAFLFFMCVLPGYILTKLSFKIQMLSTTIAANLLGLGFNVAQDGAKIKLPNIEVLVGAPCSGFRMLISLVAFAVFFAYMKEGALWRRSLLVVMTIPLSLVANSVRVALIALCGQFFGEEAMHTFHDYSGFIVLAVAFVVLWWFAKVIKCEKFRSTLFS